MLTTNQQKQREEMEALLGNSKKNRMKIKKIGHCCLVIETKGIRIMTDPGTFSTAQDQEKNIDLIVISHEHADHFHVESVKNVLANNPEAKIITNTAVGKLLDEQGIAYEILEEGNNATIKEILFEAFGNTHAPIYKEWGVVQNTGYLIDDYLFIPGDAFPVPSKPVEVLALPVSAPWMKLSEAIEYAIAVKPKKSFPVHDAILSVPQMMGGALVSVLQQDGIEFIPFNAGDEKEF